MRNFVGGEAGGFKFEDVELVQPAAARRLELYDKSHVVAERESGLALGAQRVELAHHMPRVEPRRRWTGNRAKERRSDLNRAAKLRVFEDFSLDPYALLEAISWIERGPMQVGGAVDESVLICCTLYLCQ